ncbi:MAG TPA: enoyl-CoA hydratase/isomerase family protein, partial [Candidatus Binataceae bacterium]|nr:enoyl-CoA hydratase/isomerase family protein [Candidatus Binataceae bacterium]
MPSEEVLLEIADSVATVTINRPQARNALNSAVLAELNAVLTGLSRDSSVRVVILRGAGDVAFSAGADLKEVAALKDLPARRRYFGGVAQVLEVLHRMPQPVIARVAGFALAG